MALALLSYVRLSQIKCCCGDVLESSGLLLKEKSMSDWMFNCKEVSQIDCLFSDAPALSRCTLKTYEIDKDAQSDILIGGSKQGRRDEKF